MKTVEKRVFKLNKLFEENKNNLDLKIKEHFKDIRVQIESFYDHFIQSIEKSFSHMKEKVESAENSCLSQVNIIYMKSYELKLINLKENLNPHLTIESINEMNQKQQ